MVRYHTHKSTAGIKYSQTQLSPERANNKTKRINLADYAWLVWWNILTRGKRGSFLFVYEKGGVQANKKKKKKALSWLTCHFPQRRIFPWNFTQQ